MSSRVTPTSHLASATSPMDRTEAWTASQAADLLAATSLTPRPMTNPFPLARETQVKLAIPLDDAEDKQQSAARRKATNDTHKVYGVRTLMRRDSQRRRDALLQGKEGSRRRRKWENDNLLNNPHASRPEDVGPEDWLVKPTYPVNHVPYCLAPLWDAQYARLSEKRKSKVEEAKKPGDEEVARAAKVEQELRATLKRARGAKGLLQDLEREVRGFVAQWDAKQRELEQEGLIDADSEDEEIVFVGRNGAMSDETRKNKQDEMLVKDKLIFQSLVDDHGAAFGRYLVHSIAQYYGLKTWSVTVPGDPARREAYVGLKTDPITRRPSLPMVQMPRPLWTVV
ncbi:R3H-associated N-terminal domain-containing protein [Neohortaea acidophila]|uniref:R3H-associated N-terminal domain-containing protein n=1 Tax=Neohortaea acidophila TaxID=245834 RepID=A0A6A6PZK0_9PEZI|nr:R3H-associated N-terminal domain-containing protein [Neohortaea acidophila]KAF2485201.1 R3H-associated N-terminal domain-containing protein [Neohortaea acidophila]